MELDVGVNLSASEILSYHFGQQVAKELFLDAQSSQVYPSILLDLSFSLFSELFRKHLSFQSQVSWMKPQGPA